MGWKSTIDITRETAILLILSRSTDLSSKSNEELEEMLYAIGFGDDTNLPYFGYNFNVMYEIEGKEDEK